MSKTPKQQRKIEKEKPESDRKDSLEKDTWEEDQKKHDYYYDDSHGYETYEPEDDPKASTLPKPAT